ncbi:hypothetical protein M758_2G240600 [Ceratodon purpureus]|nr:hypothetical protein M758_2G240600 [Ceratodon purpureus]
MAASSVPLRAVPGPVAQMRSVLPAHGIETSTTLLAPSICGVRGCGVGRSGYGVCVRKSVLRGFRAQSGATNVERGAEITSGSGKDNNVVFVAGATGNVGSRVVRELVKSGFQVRAGVRAVAKGQALLEAAKLAKTSSSEKEPVELVECDLEKQDTIANSLGNAGVVVCSIGASEKEISDVTGPYRIDYKATENLIKAATRAKVNHFILVTSLGTTKLGWPASILNLFWGVLIWKAKAEKALEDSGLPYTIVRPGGMERPTDTYKETHNLRLASRDTWFGGQVSNLQVAELIANCVSNLDRARFKVLEAVAETTAPLRPIEELLAEVPAERR